MAAARKRIKTDAIEYVCMSREEANAAVAQIGNLQRERETIQTAMNSEIATITDSYEERAHPLGETIKMLSRGVQAWAEVHRTDLLKGGGKTVKLASGKLSWRTRPPSVAVRGAALVIAALKRLGLRRFIRSKEEVDKEAILKEPAAVVDVKGISIDQGEDFVIVPIETELEEIAA